MMKKLARKIAVIFIGIALCFSFAQLSQAATMVNFEANGALSDVASLQFTILTPDIANTSNFTANFPAGWFDNSGGDIVNAFDGTGTSSLPTSQIGSFDIDVTLGGWAFGNQGGSDLVQDTDFFVHYDGTNYTVKNTAAVPIPGALWLLGSGLIGMVGVRRKVGKS